MGNQIFVWQMVPFVVFAYYEHSSQARIHTGFRNKYIFKKNFPSENLENGLDKLYFSNLLALDTLHPTSSEEHGTSQYLVWITQKPRKGDLGS